MKNIVFRADSSMRLGSGHVMRCLTLAEQLRKVGADEIHFICSDQPSNYHEFIESKGFKVHLIPSELSNQEKYEPGWFLDSEYTKDQLKSLGFIIHWLIVDHYQLDIRWEKAVTPYVKNIMVIDDLAKNKHHCKIILNQNLSDNLYTQYEELVPPNSIKLLGPDYALLRDEFYQVQPRVREGKIKRLLVFYGGSDPTNESEKALHAIKKLSFSELKIDVIVGASNPSRKRIEALTAQLPGGVFHYQVNNMASLINTSDFALGAGGSTTWERCLLGLPAIVTIVASNQRTITEYLGQKGIVDNLGWHEQIDVTRLADRLQRYIKTPSLVNEMSSKSSQIMERNRATRSKVVQLILGEEDANKYV